VPPYAYCVVGLQLAEVVPDDCELRCTEDIKTRCLAEPLRTLLDTTYILLIRSRRNKGVNVLSCPGAED